MHHPVILILECIRFIMLTVCFATQRTYATLTLQSDTGESTVFNIYPPLQFIFIVLLLLAQREDISQITMISSFITLVFILALSGIQNINVWLISLFIHVSMHPGKYDAHHQYSSLITHLLLIVYPLMEFIGREYSTGRFLLITWLVLLFMCLSILEPHSDNDYLSCYIFTSITWCCFAFTRN